LPSSDFLASINGVRHASLASLIFYRHSIVLLINSRLLEASDRSLSIQYSYSRVVIGAAAVVPSIVIDRDVTF
jgi:hypothetical protein